MAARFIEDHMPSIVDDFADIASRANLLNGADLQQPMNINAAPEWSWSVAHNAWIKTHPDGTTEVSHTDPFSDYGC
jgi:hypothetical protein